ncbi:FAD/NAD(P)-binding protein [Devosia sp. YIM 151766]|uniref:FAD/NAD(P)-binding protein n=1 Tax=Devosia sp. YIM 151766 TaxID=3017325 RepID=UPI00255C4180|nr:FAD/NAD(P)-binding protein [Devosia sp. YIM 151766]WIY53782.1 FAD/NAD(P)-binding protein [Devosia sp. YIM 151766]
MTNSGRQSITIIGGGASGVLLAAHLLRHPDPNLRVTLIERQGRFGQGLAYSARHRNHRVNVPALGMSAFADDPEHFWRWLQHKEPGRHASPWTFVPRRLYGAYLEDVLREAGERLPGRLVVLSEEVEALHETPKGVEIALGNGTSLASRWAILAVGHETQPLRGKGIAVRAGSDSDTALDPEAHVMILGSGLSMVDAWVSLSDAGHAGPITVVSRNGLVPRGHRDVAPLDIAADDVPFGASLNDLTAWFRALVTKTESRGGDWRSVVDGLRPYNQRLWQSWPVREKRQFLRHARPWWNIHRHRLPPDLHAGLVKAIEAGQVQLVAAEFVDIERAGKAVRAIIRPRGTKRREIVEVARVYDCGGVTVDVRASANPVIRQLIQSGAARPDAMRIGLDVDENCALIAADGSVSPRVRVVGPLTRGRYFEIEAIPDIRLQCRAVADNIMAGEAAS